MRKIDYLLITGIVLIFLALVFSITFYFNAQKTECIQSPLTYGAQQLENNFDVIAYGTIILVNSEGKRAPRLEFNSTDIKIIE